MLFARILLCVLFIQSNADHPASVHHERQNLHHAFSHAAPFSSSHVSRDLIRLVSPFIQIGAENATHTHTVETTMQSSTSPDHLEPTQQYVHRAPLQDVIQKTKLTSSFRQEDCPIESESHGGAEQLGANPLKRKRSLSPPAPSRPHPIPPLLSRYLHLPSLPFPPLPFPSRPSTPPPPPPFAFPLPPVSNSLGRIALGPAPAGPGLADSTSAGRAFPGPASPSPRSPGSESSGLDAHDPGFPGHDSVDPESLGTVPAGPASPASDSRVSPPHDSNSHSLHIVRRCSDSGPLIATSVPHLWYRGYIVQRERDEAKEYALLIDETPRKKTEVSEHVFWTDCSIVKQCGAASVAWRSAQSEPWETAAYPWPQPTNDTTLVELFAVERALAIAIEQVTKAQQDAFEEFCRGSKEIEVQPDYRVMVFTDSDGALDRLRTETSLRSSSRTWDLVYGCIRHYEGLERLGVAVELHLVPGHRGVPGNIEADAAAYALAHHRAHGAVARQTGTSPRQARGVARRARRPVSSGAANSTQTANPSMSMALWEPRLPTRVKAGE